MSFAPREYLRHILAEADYLVTHSRELAPETFRADEALRRAFVRSPEIIEEAAKSDTSPPASALLRQRPRSRPRIRVTNLSPYVSLATSVLIRARTSPARPAFSAAFRVFVYAAQTSRPAMS